MTKRTPTNSGSQQDHKSSSNIVRKVLWILPVAACIVLTVLLIVPVIKNSFQATGKDPTHDFPRISRVTVDEAIDLFGDDLLIDKFSLNEFTKVNEKYTLIWERGEFEKKYYWYMLKSTINYIEDNDEDNQCRSHTVEISIGFSRRARQLLDLGYVELPEGVWKPDRITDTENINGVDVDFNFSGVYDKEFPSAESCFDLNGRTYSVYCCCGSSCCKEVVLQTVHQILS